MWRCINNIPWGYCKGTPKGKLLGEKADTMASYERNSCTRDPAKCKQYQTFTQVAPPEEE